ncbi:hypothetical protein V5N11_001446 [Cardamine amara subsp. amara]|uniref:DUF4283 domain-containing protein n=1 Tax=Cardamine amara subsp. amara TaxID=228776 RepID=A0ABD1AZM9_CARAN
MAEDSPLRPPPQPPNLTSTLNLSQFPPLPSSASPISAFPLSRFGSNLVSSSPWAPAPVREEHLVFTTALSDQNDLHSSTGTAATSSQLNSHSSADVTMQEASVLSVSDLASQQVTTTLPEMGSTSENQNLTRNHSPSPSLIHVIPSCHHPIPNLVSAKPITAANQPKQTLIEPSTDQPSPNVLKASQENIKNWAQKLESSTNRKLKRVSSPSFSPEGIPRVKIPDSVFHRGAELHKDFVLGIFTGKTPSFGHIQTVLTHIWGRGIKLEIHLRPASRSMLVRIPNATIRQKVVEQEIWHIGNSLFYVAQWSPNVAVKPPTFSSIPLWAHVRGIPFDLYNQDGLSRVADLLGLPVEVDEFTRRMVNIDVAHLKVRADCTKPLPTTAEIEKDDGEVVTLSISYPWIPPTCPCCRQMGHLEAYCPNAKWSERPTTINVQNEEPAAGTSDTLTSVTEPADVNPSGKKNTTTVVKKPISATTATASSLEPLNAHDHVSPEYKRVDGVTNEIQVVETQKNQEASSNSPADPMVVDFTIVEDASQTSLPSLDGSIPSPDHLVDSSNLAFTNSISPPYLATHIIALPAQFPSRPLVPSHQKPNKSQLTTPSVVSLNPFSCLQSLIIPSDHVTSQSASNIDPSPLSLTSSPDLPVPGKAPPIPHSSPISPPLLPKSRTSPFKKPDFTHVPSISTDINLPLSLTTSPTPPNLLVSTQLLSTPAVGSLHNGETQQ